MLVKRLCAMAALVVACLCAKPTEAAQVKIAGLLDDAVVISVSGELQINDLQTFEQFAKNLPKAVVAFDSSGGQLVAGLEIGESIRAHGYATAVVDGASCTSACALAWLAGQPRYQAATGRVGFHAAYVMDKGVATERGAANAMIGAYLTRLGFGYSAVTLLTSAPPDEITWLTPDVARRLGISIALIEKREASAPAPPRDAGRRCAARSPQCALEGSGGGLQRSL